MEQIITLKVDLFSPPYGDCTSWLNLDKSELLFSPPYGDGTSLLPSHFALRLFSPPYGDGTETGHYILMESLFSPPYGDCTLNISQNTAKLKSRMARKYSLYYNDVLLC